MLSLIAALVARGTEFENTDAEAVLDGGSHDFPANFWTVGKVVEFKALVRVIDNNGADTLTLKVYFGTVTLTTAVATFGAVDVNDDDHAWIKGTLVAQDNDGDGVVDRIAIVIEGNDLAASGAGTRETHYAANSLDATVATKLEVAGTWSAAHVDNEAAVEAFLVTELPN